MTSKAKTKKKHESPKTKLAEKMEPVPEIMEAEPVLSDQQAIRMEENARQLAEAYCKECWEDNQKLQAKLMFYAQLLRECTKYLTNDLRLRIDNALR